MVGFIRAKCTITSSILQNGQSNLLHKLLYIFKGFNDRSVLVESCDIVLTLEVSWQNWMFLRNYSGAPYVSSSLSPIMLETGYATR